MLSGWDEIEHWWGKVWKVRRGPHSGEVITDPSGDIFHWVIKELGDVIYAGSERNHVLAVAKVNRYLQDTGGTIHAN